MIAIDLYKEGKLSEAVKAARADVKSHPTDTAERGLLAELLCFSGELERADKLLDVMGLQDPQIAVTLALFRQLIRAETLRREFFEQGRQPEFLGQPSDCLRLHLDASIAIREGKHDEAVEILARAEEQRRPVTGRCGEEPFGDFRDLDDTASAFFEVLTSTGKYFWIATDCVELIEFKKPEQIRDLLWREARMVVRGGPDGEVFLPVVYHGTSQSAEDDIRLGRATAWDSDEGRPVTGVGQRMFMLGDQARAILELEEISFDNAQEVGPAEDEA